MKKNEKKKKCQNRNNIQVCEHKKRYLAYFSHNKLRRYEDDMKMYAELNKQASEATAFFL
jgi:hypothetical protein